MARSHRAARSRRTAVLAGGVGAARFLRGLSSLIDPSDLTVIVNTGDDETFFGLHVSPDVDTVLYTLAGKVSPAQGWGVADDTFACLETLSLYYDETWFRLGDRDLATHIFRTDALQRGKSLSWVTRKIASDLGVRANVIPMSDQPVRTFVDVAGRGSLPFQRYLVRQRGAGSVRKIRYRGVAAATPAAGVLQALRRAHRIILPPSNPLVSIGPILGLKGLRAALRSRRAPVAAVSPIVHGAPVKGPLHRMLKGLGHEVSAVGVARLYRGLVDVFVLDQRDADLAPRIAALGMRPVVTDTLMTNAARSRRLAATVLAEMDT
jgi:LPPG:FO 2-phospho-L-lactate transferase